MSSIQIINATQKTLKGYDDIADSYDYKSNKKAEKTDLSEIL